MYRNSCLFLTTLVVMAFIQGCYRSGYTVDDLIEGRVSTLSRINTGATIFTDSLGCTISLTDSILFLNEGADLPAPKLSVVLRNFSSTNLRIPFYKCFVSPYESITSGIDVQIYKFGEEPHRVFFLAKTEFQGIDSNYAVLAVGESVKLPFTVDLSHACEFAQSCDDTGTYIIRVLYKNVWYFDSMTPVWVGQQWSNPVQFNVRRGANK